MIGVGKTEFLGSAATNEPIVSASDDDDDDR
jgi:hypothetical protein